MAAIGRRAASPNVTHDVIASMSARCAWQASRLQQRGQHQQLILLLRSDPATAAARDMMASMPRRRSLASTASSLPRVAIVGVGGVGGVLGALRQMGGVN